MSRNLTYGLGILLVALLLYLGFLASPGPTSKDLASGKPAPNFILKTLDGKEVSLNDYRGKVVLINFWASWCPPCREEMPLFRKVYENYKDKGFELLAISIDASQEAVIRFVKDYGLSFPVLLDDGRVSNLYRVQGLPTSILVDREGRIVKVRLGEYKEIENDLKKIL